MKRLVFHRAQHTYSPRQNLPLRLLGCASIRVCTADMATGWIGSGLGQASQLAYLANDNSYTF